MAPKPGVHDGKTPEPEDKMNKKRPAQEEAKPASPMRRVRVRGKASVPSPPRSEPAGPTPVPADEEAPWFVNV